MFSYFITHRALEDIVSAYQALIIDVIIQNELYMKLLIFNIHLLCKSERWPLNDWICGITTLNKPKSWRVRTQITALNDCLSFW